MTDQAERLRALVKSRKPKRPPAQVFPLAGTAGSGCSTLAQNLAALWAAQGRRTLVFDAAGAASGSAASLGVKADKLLADAFAKGTPAGEIAQQGVRGVTFIAGAPDPAQIRALSSERRNVARRSLKALAEDADVILLDLGSGRQALDLAGALGTAVLTVRQEKESLLEAYAFVKALCAGKNDISLIFVMSMATNEPAAAAVAKGFSETAQKHLGVAPLYLGCVLREDTVQEAEKLHVPLALAFPESGAAAQIAGIADRLINENLGAKRSFEDAVADLFGNDGVVPVGALPG